MSAIAGLVNFDRRPVLQDEVGHMIDVLAHRGLRRSLLCEDSVGFACRSVHSSSHPSGDREFFRGTHSPFVLAADARLDNARELAMLLGFERPATVATTELISAAYARWGAACADKFHGDFAFALWDPNTRSVFCARDPMGVRPLYFVHSHRRFAFASEIRALLTLDDVSHELDPEMVALFIEAEPEDRDRTLYRHIFRLGAGHTLRAEATSCVQTRYWNLENVRDVHYAADEDYAEGFRALFTEAVRCRLTSDRPLAASLSGGLDSSSVVCMARHLRTQGGADLPFHTFSLVFPSLPNADLRLIDERRYIGAVVREGGLEAHDVRGDRLTPLSDLREQLAELDEPYSAPNLYLHRAMYAAARAQGAHVFLDGFDGDSAVSHGFGRLDALVGRGDWDSFESEVRGYARHRGIGAETVLTHYGFPELTRLARAGQLASWTRTSRELARRFGLSRRTIALDYGIRPLVPDALANRWRAARGGATRPLLRRELALRVAERRAILGRQASSSSTSDRRGHIDGLSQVAYQTTLELANRAAARYGIEPRYPFFDRRLIEFCVGLPDEQKFSGGWSRYHMRRAMTGVLPAEIQWRADKGNLSPNFFRALRLTDMPAIDQLPFEMLESYVDLSTLDAMRRRQSRSAPSAVDADGLTLFRASILATWLFERAHGAPRSARTARLSPVAERRAPRAHRAAASAAAFTSHQE